jgi:hypothetical protein
MVYFHGMVSVGLYTVCCNLVLLNSEGFSGARPRRHTQGISAIPTVTIDIVYPCVPGGSVVLMVRKWSKSFDAMERPVEG